MSRAPGVRVQGAREHEQIRPAVREVVVKGGGVCV